jgi:hypothetical protein
MPEKPFVTIERVRRMCIEVPKLAATIIVSSVEDYKGRGWGTPYARIKGPAPGEFTVAAHGVEALHEGLLNAFAVFKKAFGAYGERAEREGAHASIKKVLDAAYGARFHCIGPEAPPELKVLHEALSELDLAEVTDE